MYGHHITPTAVRTPISRRLLGFIKFFNLVACADPPEWCERRYSEAWQFRPRRP